MVNRAHSSRSEDDPPWRAIRWWQGRRAADRIGALTDALTRQSETDPLTGLPNRAALLDELADRTSATAGSGAGVGVLLVGLDGVERIRRTLGHDQGDALVLAMVERIRNTVDGETYVARLDAGELAVVVGPTEAGSTSADQIYATAARLLDVIARPLGLADSEVATTASIGIMAPRAGGDRLIDGRELLRDASSALDLARAAGGAQARSYQRDLDERAIGDLRLAAELRQAIPDGELEVYYQPIVSLPDRRLAGAEALIRWNHPRQGVLTPDRWLEVADSAGLLPEIGRATLDEVCRRFATMSGRTGDRPLRIAVNLAPSELRHPDLVPAVTAILERSGLNPTQLVIEVSDRAVVDDGAAAAIGALRRLGVRISLDDFGTGLAAIGRLGHLPIDELKLDDSVVAGVAAGGAEQSVLESIIALCARLGIEVVAEGVSTERDSDALAVLGCQFAQGWMFGRPLPFSRFVALLDRIDTADSDGADSDTADPVAGRSVEGSAPTGATGETGQTVDNLS